MSAFSVTAQYKYSYVYEGKTISFRKGEKFQLLSKANNDWWQVRRWNQGEADDIYVPANYMKEVEQPLKEENPLYENVQALLEKNSQSAQGNQSNNSTGNGHIPQPAPKPSPTHRREPEYAMPNSPGTARKQSSLDNPPKSASPHRDSPIFKEWQKGYALPGQKHRSQSVDDELVAATEKKQRAPPPPVAAKSRDHIRSADKAQKQALEPALNRQRRGDSPPNSEPGQQAPPTLAPPEVRQKQRHHQRPQSYVYDTDETTSSSFSTFKTPAPLSGDPAPAAPQKKPVMRTFSPLKKTPSPEGIVSAGNGKDVIS